MTQLADRAHPRAAAGAPARTPAQLALGAALVLAVAGSALLVFSSSAPLLRLAVVVLAWVAMLCGIALTRYRREAALSDARADEQQKIYELELARELNARQEQQLVLQRTLRAEISEQVRAEATDELAELRAEIRALRETLSALFDGQMLVERVSLHAESTRVLSRGDTTLLTTGPATLEAHGVGIDDNVVDVEPTEYSEPTEPGWSAEPAADLDTADLDPADLDTADLDTSAEPATDEPTTAEPSTDEPDGAHSAGRSVTELIAAYGGSVPGGRRRRRTGD
ncbi:DUF6779 domain-containing protein [Rhodococcus sp. X156]|uniref:DUF6779 domain-containing protein n=1 Tax=Rhodococcus sp. X156 TaxID=2499145 RepID=UPI000FD81E55|nr:DUF6779 domain-containing protein [Rhodococcus sp. X156]